ncbi:MAG: hypothetical protein LBB90_08590, partial [Tannerella sp.]|nr:hypothetical protein [Tannerella sp.]
RRTSILAFSDKFLARRTSILAFSDKFLARRTSILAFSDKMAVMKLFFVEPDFGAVALGEKRQVSGFRLQAVQTGFFDIYSGSQP